jgi:hypothetical protein
MSTTASPYTTALALLTHAQSPKRRSGAKQLRKLKNPAAGPALLLALQHELHDRRTWETQYQMIMAIAENDYRPACPYLETLTHQHFEATMVYTALGDAIVRLGRSTPDDVSPALRLLATNNHMLITGALRAIAMLQLKPIQADIDQLITYVLDHSPHHGADFWIAAAAPGWSGERVAQFLARAALSQDDNTRRAALAAQQKRYLKWSPL